MKIQVVTPCLNDAESLHRLVHDFSNLNIPDTNFHILVVDDGSSPSIDRSEDWIQGSVHGVELIRLSANFGHQRAIAAGLCYSYDHSDFDYLLVIDSDGEDRPENVSALLESALKSPGSIAVATRSSRTDSLRFRGFYAVFKVLFRFATGKNMDFGNFVLLPRSCAESLVSTESLWNHFPGTVMRSRIAITRVNLPRSNRYAGESRMNFISLVNHGLSSMSVFLDVMLTRMIFIVATLVCAGFFTIMSFVALRFFVDFQLSDWMSVAFGLSALALSQILATLIATIFLVLVTRSRVPEVPLKTYQFLLNRGGHS